MLAKGGGNFKINESNGALALLSYMQKRKKIFVIMAGTNLLNINQPPEIIAKRQVLRQVIGIVKQ